MSQPKKKVARGRRDRRRYNPNNLLAKPAMSVCQACGEPVRPHRICRCGQYDGRQVLPARQSETAAAE